MQPVCLLTHHTWPLTSYPSAECTLWLHPLPPCHKAFCHVFLVVMHLVFVTLIRVRHKTVAIFGYIQEKNTIAGCRSLVKVMHKVYLDQTPISWVSVLWMTLHPNLILCKSLHQVHSNLVHQCLTPKVSFCICVSHQGQWQNVALGCARPENGLGKGCASKSRTLSSLRANSNMHSVQPVPPPASDSTFAEGNRYRKLFARQRCALKPFLVINLPFSR